MKVSILIPCLNEAETLQICIKKASTFLTTNKIDGEILIADNGSTDGSQEIAVHNGARVIDVYEKGYGSALIGGINAANGKYIIMGDADDSYDFSSLQPFLDKLEAGYELVMGNRFKGGIKPGAMPLLHRYLGNPVLSFIGKLFFGSQIGDFHCGLRGFSKEAALKMDLRCKGMEFASEMIVKATLLKLKIAEVPTILYPDGRSRPPHLRTWRDGWRHLRFLLMYSPDWLFLYPGILIMLTGTLFSSLLIYGPLNIGNVIFDIHTLLYTSLLIVIGFQSLTFYLFTKVFAINEGLLPKNEKLNNTLQYFNLEKGLIIGMLLFVLGISLTIKAFFLWNEKGFGQLNSSQVLRWVIPACTSLIIGVQMIFYSFFYGILTIKNK